MDKMVIVKFLVNLGWCSDLLMKRIDSIFRVEYIEYRWLLNCEVDVGKSF